MYLIMAKEIDPKHRRMAAALVRELHMNGKMNQEVFEVLEDKYKGGEHDLMKVSQKIRKMMNDPELEQRKSSGKGKRQTEACFSNHQ